MPFRCKCGKTFEKVETFSSHTSGCALFHQRRVSTSEVLISTNQLSINTSTTTPINSHTRRLSSILSPIYSKSDYFFNNGSLEQDSSPKSAPVTEGEQRFSFMMPTALSIQNNFECVKRRRSMSYATTNAATATYK